MQMSPQEKQLRRLEFYSLWKRQEEVTEVYKVYKWLRKEEEAWTVHGLLPSKPEPLHETSGSQFQQ